MELKVIYNNKCITVSSIDEAVKIAEEAELDLVRLNENTFKVMDFGKYQYQAKKKEKKNKQPTTEIKELQIGYNIAEADLERKIRNAEEWLKENHPVRIRMVTRGRERNNSDRIFYLLSTVIDCLEEKGLIASRPDLQRIGDADREYIYIVKPYQNKSKRKGRES